MKDIEIYIQENREAFDRVPLPADSKERFMNALKREKRKRTMKTTVVTFTTSVAASAVIIISLMSTDLTKVIRHQHRLLAAKEMEVISVIETNIPHETDYIVNDIRSITSEAIPLEELLPDELSDREKIVIIKEYYGQKSSALEHLKNQYIKSL